MDQAQFEQMSRDDQILVWEATKKELDALKDREIKMRKHIVESNSHGFDTTQVGTQNVDLGNGWILKAVVKQAYRLDSDHTRVEAALDRLEDWRADRLVKWSPTLSVSEYKQLSDAERAVIDSVLTVSAAAPTLSLIAPKGA